MPHFIYLISETSKMKDKCPSTATLQAPTIHGYRRRMTQHLGETKAGERLPALSREEERAGSVSRCLKQSPHPSCASELLRSWASLPEEPEAQPAAPDLRLPLLPRATGRHRSARSRRAHRFLPSAARPAPAPRRWERGTGGGRAEPRRAGPGREGRAPPPHTHLSPALRQQPRPSGGEAPHTNTHRSPRERGTHTAGSGPGSPTPPPFPLRRGSTVPRRSATRTALPPRSGATAHLRVSAGRWRLAAGSPRLQAQGHAAGDVITQRWAGHCAGDVIAQEGEGHARALGARFCLPRLGAVGPFRLEKSAELSAWRHPALPLQR